MPSSSSPSRTNITAHAPPVCLAKRMAAALDRKAPPAELSQSRAIHSAVWLRPIANTGMASFRIALSGRRSSRDAADLSLWEDMSINFNSKHHCAPLFSPIRYHGPSSGTGWPIAGTTYSAEAAEKSIKGGGHIAPPSGV